MYGSIAVAALGALGAIGAPFTSYPVLARYTIFTLSLALVFSGLNGAMACDVLRRGAGP
jgi:hypothetical protein